MLSMESEPWGILLRGIVQLNIHTSPALLWKRSSQGKESSSVEKHRHILPLLLCSLLLSSSSSSILLSVFHEDYHPFTDVIRKCPLSIF